MSLYSRFLRAVGGQNWFAAVAARTVPRLDRVVYRLTRGRRLATPPSVPTFFLTTTGRRSGESRTVAVSYVEDGGDFVVVGSNWGKATTPEWALNLAANPRASVEIGGEETSVEALLVPVGERDALWEAFGSMWPAYAVYRRRAKDRVVQMFRLVST